MEKRTPIDDDSEENNIRTISKNIKTKEELKRQEENNFHLELSISFQNENKLKSKEKKEFRKKLRFKFEVGMVLRFYQLTLLQIVKLIITNNISLESKKFLK
ncbi:hypothetical protein [Facklamia miroungae]|uniref:hypothetical protein n=1 Tax=Facklamia miroungae TaxID=120956 RepID=UPI00117A984D|nr:hypothetical protein [Facklamia miroungae]NKZ29757.1 hypothetical protein [Facklamia miroungae]